MIGLALLGIAVLAACGNDLQVVGPDQPAATSTSSSVPGNSGGAGATTTTVAADDTTTTTETTAPPTTAPTTTIAVDPMEAAADASVAFVNQKREEAGLSALEVDPDLVDMASGWANQIASDQDLRHNPNLGTEAPDQYTALGENVGYAPSASAIDQGWWESDGHRENILRSSFQAVGIAFVVDADGTTWGVQVFAGS